MPAPNVDLVFVIDASESMQPCFDELRQHLGEILKPMQGYISKVRFGLVAQSAGGTRGVAVYDHQFLCGAGPETLQKLYALPKDAIDAQGEFFTDDVNKFSSALEAINPQGNEDMLVALDVALDFPFSPVANTKRVVAMFSDEKFEDGISLDAHNSKIPDLIKKIQDRHIQLFVAIPDSDAIQQLAEVDRSEVELVDGGIGLSNVDFRQLLGQMGKSISGSMLQSTAEPNYQRALFGQDGWSVERAISSHNREVILRVGEKATLNNSLPIEHIHVQMTWTKAIDLDLHAFYRLKSGNKGEVYYVNKSGPNIELDYDAGVGDKAGHNEENIDVSRLEDFDQIIFATKIFGDGDRFSDYDGKVIIETNCGDKIMVPLSAQKLGRWCSIASINNESELPEVININQVHDEEPEI
jgi:uncharacterized protein involved in tellurium resistance